MRMSCKNNNKWLIVLLLYLTILMWFFTYELQCTVFTERSLPWCNCHRATASFGKPGIGLMKCLVHINTCIDHCIAMCGCGWEICHCRREEIWSLPSGPVQVHSVCEFAPNLNKQIENISGYDGWDYADCFCWDKTHGRFRAICCHLLQGRPDEMSVW